MSEKIRYGMHSTTHDIRLYQKREPNSKTVAGTLTEEQYLHMLEVMPAGASVNAFVSAAVKHAIKALRGEEIDANVEVSILKAEVAFLKGVIKQAAQKAKILDEV